MPKKFAGENSKAVAARARKDEVKRTEADKKQKAAEDAYWADDDKHANRKLQRKEEDERKRAEAAKRRAELKSAADEEMKALTAQNEKAAAAAAQAKVTRAAIEARKEAEAKARAEETKAAALKNKKIEVMGELSENVNQLTVQEETATNVDEAIEVLGAVEVSPDKHPEKRMRAAWQAFEDERLPQLKKENPMARLSQLKQMLFKEWQKSPANPKVAAAMA